jgi:hypothetical protein
MVDSCTAGSGCSHISTSLISTLGAVANDSLGRVPLVVVSTVLRVPLATAVVLVPRYSVYESAVVTAVSSCQVEPSSRAEVPKAAEDVPDSAYSTWALVEALWMLGTETHWKKLSPARPVAGMRAYTTIVQPPGEWPTSDRSRSTMVPDSSWLVAKATWGLPRSYMTVAVPEPLRVAAVWLPEVPVLDHDATLVPDALVEKDRLL